MTGILIAVMFINAVPQADESALAKLYLALCETTRGELVKKTEQLIKAQEDAGNLSSDDSRRLNTARAELELLKSRPAPLVPIRIPPENDDVGVFVSRTVDGRQGRFVDVLEVIDAHSAVIRVWHTPRVTPDNKDADQPSARATKHPVPLDFWAQGIDTASMKNHSTAELPQVFRALGNMGLPTDCGTRSLMVLRPIDVEPFRGGAKKE